MIQVTKTFLPDFEKYCAVLKRSWNKNWITNNGELVQELEEKLKEFLQVKNLLFCNNGTIVLQMALKAFDITREVITTPFSYVATTNSIIWENSTPVFVDIEPETFCIDADKIEQAITPGTQAIMATHVYGYPCKTEKIEKIAEKYKLKVIYDGAHAFGCIHRGRPLLSYGDISTCSFHATKVFHTVEGGCIITNDDALHEKLKLYRSFGHIGDDYYSIGINGKNSEFHAAMGICNLERMTDIIAARKKISHYYDELLGSLPLQRPKAPHDFVYNYAYYPVIFESEQKLQKVQLALQKSGINTRRYFYPSLNRLPYLANAARCPVSEDIAVRVLCLPLYYDLSKADLNNIAGILASEIQ
jgi:dTDP-4-amino-4,6-dideoxygalactose transaminase